MDIQVVSDIVVVRSSHGIQGTLLVQGPLGPWTHLFFLRSFKQFGFTASALGE